MSLQTLEPWFHDEVPRHGVPGAALAVWVDGQAALTLATGVARYDPKRPLHADTPFDLASLTKALVTSCLCARAAQRGLLAVDEPLQRYLPQAPPRVTPRHLLEHRSGWPAWRPFYASFQDWGSPATRQALLTEVLSTPLEAEPGTTTRYSDLGFLALTRLLETLDGRRLDAQYAEFLTHLERPVTLGWAAPGAAATEDCPVRGQVIEGTVHDLNAAAMGGVAGHAGLFGTVSAVASFADQLVVAAQRRDPTLAGEVLHRWWVGPSPNTWFGGWDSPSRGGPSSTGRYFPDETRGHLGFTGTSLWVVPSRRTVVVLLTNRVHPSSAALGVRTLRPAVHDAVASALGWPEVRA